MDIRLQNTLSGKKEVFVPLNIDSIRMYNCGPTVYDYAHIGNLRSFVFADTLKRVLKYNSYKVKQVMNITDVGHLSSDGDYGEDKMSKALARESKPFTLEAMIEIGSFYAERFKEDLKSLNIDLPDEFPKASLYIKEDIEIIEILLKKDIAYKSSSGIYFDISKFPKYGALGKQDLQGQKDGARIAIDAEKRNPGDFSLWKNDSDLGWDTPWGKGFPGWHIECSAMSRKFLGQPFDIHTGGIDLIPIHHNNEIAQSEAAFEELLANYWLHSAFLDFNNNKMSKSSGTFITLKSLVENGISPLAYRYWLLTAQYSSPINFTIEAVESAQTALIRLLTIYRDLREGGTVDTSYEDRFHEFVNDDLDTPNAIALIWNMLKDSKVNDADKKATLMKFDEVLGLNIASLPPIEIDEVPPEVQALVDAREEARKAKEWGKADALRDEIAARGFSVEDKAEGIRIVRND